MKIWLGNLAAYAAGTLCGEWVEITGNDKEITDALHRIGCLDEKGGLRDEYFIADTDEVEAPFSASSITEYTSPYNLEAQVRAWDALSGDEQAAVGAYMEAYTNDISEAVKEYRNGSYDFYPGEDLDDVAHDLVEDGSFGNVPEALYTYIDFDKLARDLEIDGYTETTGGVLVTH